VVCPCFVGGEEAGSVFDVPADHYPIEVLRVGIGWASQFGGAPQSLEQGIHVYESGLPNPGVRLATLPGPVLSDGFINEFDLEAQLGGGVAVASGPFTVSLEFANANSGDLFAPSMVHDGNGCQPSKNVVFASPGTWADACGLGVTGDWVVVLTYRRTDCSVTGIDDLYTVASRPLAVLPPVPNPMRNSTRLSFALGEEAPVTVTVFDLAGRPVATLFQGTLPAGGHDVSWNRATDAGRAASSGLYFMEVRAGSRRAVTKVLIAD
jgi:hypothetical protein